MSEDFDLGRIERMLERTPAPESVPETFAATARREALSRPDVVARAPRRWRRPASWRLVSVAVAFGAAAAVAGTLAISTQGGFSAQYSVSLSGPHGATAVVDFGYAKNGVREMVMHINGLPPAGRGRYYEMWFKPAPGAENVSAVTFDTPSGGGSTTIHAVIPAGMHWHHCWVMLEANGGQSVARVLTT